MGLLEIISARVDNLPDFSSIAFCTALGVPGDWQFSFEDNTIERKLNQLISY